jgi:hypothetical protein
MRYIVRSIPWPDSSIMRLPRWRLVGFTGHRHLANESAVRESIAAALTRLAHHDARLAVRAPPGTGAIVAYARALGRPLWIVDPNTGLTSHEGPPIDEPAGDRTGSACHVPAGGGRALGDLAEVNYGA